MQYSKSENTPYSDLHERTALVSPDDISVHFHIYHRLHIPVFHYGYFSIACPYRPDPRERFIVSETSLHRYLVLRAAIQSVTLDPLPAPGSAQLNMIQPDSFRFTFSSAVGLQTLASQAGQGFCILYLAETPGILRMAAPDRHRPPGQKAFAVRISELLFVLFSHILPT